MSYTETQFWAGASILDDAHLVRVDGQAGVLCVWHGGPYVNVYDVDGNAVFAFGVPDDATRAQVACLVRDYIEETLDRV